jgi:hypothetical protein
MGSRKLQKVKKRIFRSIRKHNESLVIISVALSLLGILPFLIGDRLVIIQRVRVVELPTITEYQTHPQIMLNFEIGSTVTITRANGMVERG